MIPSLTGDYTGNSAETYTVLGSQLRGGRIARRVFSANRSYQIIRELGATLALAASQLFWVSATCVSVSASAVVRLNISGPTFSDFVLRVFGLCAEPQMGRVTAGRVVARVTDTHIGRYRSNPVLIRKAMRLDHLPVSLEYSVTLPEPGTTPFPATVGDCGLIHVKEESFGRGGYALRHQRGPFSLIVPGVVDAIARRFVALNYTGLGAH